MDAAQRLWRHVETWRTAVADFLALVRDLDEPDAGLPTDLDGWSVGDVVAHIAHLESVAAGGPEDTLEVVEAPHLRNPIGYYTEAGVLARRGRGLERLCQEIEEASAARYAAFEADPPTDPDAPVERAPGGADWTISTLLRNRPFDVWVHEQDIRRAVGRPGNLDCDAAAHTLGMLGRGLPMVLGKRVGAAPGTSCRVRLPQAGLTWTCVVGDDGRGAPAEDVEQPTCTLTLSTEDFLVLGTGRRGPEDTDPTIDGDRELAEQVLAHLNVTF